MALLFSGHNGYFIRSVGELAATLKPEYAELNARVDVAGASVKDTAGALGIAAGNAGVRLLRARRALRARLAEACGACATQSHAAWTS